MSGAKGKKTHVLYKEEDGSIILHVLDYHSCLPRLVAALLLSKVAVLFSTRCSRAGIPPISFEESHWESFHSSFHIRFLGQASAYIISTALLEIVQCC